MDVTQIREDQVRLWHTAALDKKKIKNVLDLLIEL